MKSPQDAIRVATNIGKWVVEEPDGIRERLQIPSIEVLLGFRRVIDHLLGVLTQFCQSWN